MKTVKEAIAEFDGLTATQCAGKMKANNIKGRQHDADNCALAKYLMKHCGDEDFDLFQNELPDGLNYFIAGFDAGAYPYLVLKEKQ